MSYLLGIDVGTTRTAAAIGRVGGRSGEIEIINLGDRSSAVPSVLYLGDDGGVVVGEAAERRAVSDPDRVVREFKRRIGDPTPVVVAGRPWAPEELSARLVRWVVDRAGAREGGPAVRIAVTHPASWGSHKKDLLGAALAHHGLPVAFLPEPQAAAMHYAAAERVDPGSTIAVYDLGGGTFDAAIVHKDGNGGFSLVGRPEGIERLGGIDFDEVVFEHVREGIPEAFEGLDDSDPAVLSAVAGIRRECTEAKEALSSDTEVSIPVLTPAAQGSVRLHRSEFEAIIRPHVEETVGALRRAVISAGLSPEQLSAVLLVGGSSRIPLVAQLVSEQLGRPVAVDADPKNAIAKGAALSLMPAHVQVPIQRRTARTGAMPPVGFRQGGRPGPGGSGTYAGAGALGAGAPGAGALGTGALGGGAFDGQGRPPMGVPTNQRLSATGGTGARPPVPPPPPRPAPAYADRPPADYDAPDHDRDDRYRDERPARRTPPALLVTAGAVAAAAAVLAAVFLIPDRQDLISENTGDATGTSQQPLESPLPPEVTATPDVVPTEDEGPGPATATPKPAVPPVRPPTPKPAATRTPAPSTKPTATPVPTPTAAPTATIAPTPEPTVVPPTPAPTPAP